MRRFAALCLAMCMSVAVPVATAYAEEVPTPQESQVQDIQEVSSLLNIATSLEGINLPAGAERVTYTYHGVVYESAAKTANGLYLLPVIQEDTTVQWYVYNETADRAVPYVEFSGLDTTYVIVAPGDDALIPTGYESVYIDVAGKTLPAWFNGRAGDSNMYLIFARDSHGNEGFFRFDGTTGNSIRFVADPDVEAMSKATAFSEEAASMKASFENAEAGYQQQIESLNTTSGMQKQSYDKLYEKFRKYSFIGLCVAAAAAVLLLIFFISMLVKSSKLKKARKKIVELEKEKQALRSSRPSAGRRPVEQRNPASRRDPRMTEVREEGTSAVRRAPRKQDTAFQDSTSTSRVTRVAANSETDAPKASTRPNPNRAARPAQPRPAQSRPAQQAAKKDLGETQVFEKPLTEQAVKPRVQELEELDDLFNEAVKSQEKNQTAEVEMDAANLEGIAARLNTMEANDVIPEEEEVIDFSRKPETSRPVRKARPAAKQVAEDEFSLTDFNDI